MNVAAVKLKRQEAAVRTYLSYRHHKAHTMAGGHGQMPGARGGHPIHVHPARPLYRFAATGLGAAMWFFLFYRARHDMPVLLGWRHPWEH